MDTILVLMQVGRGHDWTDRGLPELVNGYDRSGSPMTAGAEWMFDTHPAPIGDDWRLLVWTDIRNGTWHRDKPDAVVTPADYRAAIADRGLSRSHARRRRPRLEATVTLKRRAWEMELGDMVLVTTDKNNTTLPASTGPWYVADRTEPGCVAARISGEEVLTRGDQEMISWRTPIGLVDRIPPMHPVIPVRPEEG